MKRQALVLNGNKISTELSVQSLVINHRDHPGFGKQIRFHDFERNGLRKKLASRVRIQYRSYTT